MEEIHEFSPEVIEKLGYYVYRLIDPRNGQTFYVGKGKGNRVFAHVKGALKNYNGQDYTEADEDDISAKYSVIREIHNAGLEVIHLIQRYGMKENEAFEVEAALIDCYMNLTNIQSGHYSERGVTNAYTLEHTLSVKPYVEPKDIKYMIIKTSWDRVNFLSTTSSVDPVYLATRYCWKIDKSRADKYPYVLGVIDGIVEGVYRVDYWQESDVEGKKEFVGHEAEKEIKDIFYHKRIPDVYKGGRGRATPIRYSQN